MAEIAGRTILVTRGREHSEAWATELEAHGASTVIFPCISCEPIRDDATAAALDAALEGADWLVFTSVRGVHGAAELVGARRVGSVRIAVVGASTAAAAREIFGRADLLAPEGTSRSLGVALAREIRDSLRSGAARVVAAGAEAPRADLEEALESVRARVSHVPVYRTVSAPPREPRVNLGELGVDTIFLASPSAVTGLVGRARVPASVRIVTLGPSTSAAVRERGLRVDGEAVERSLEAMIEATP
jgi:uroporphyrinogen-III synthase